MNKIYDPNEVPDHIYEMVLRRTQEIYKVLLENIHDHEHANIYINSLINASIALIEEISSKTDGAEMMESDLKEMYCHAIEGFFKSETEQK